MKNRAIKLIISICVISCLMVGFCTAFASADLLAGAGLLGGALGSLGVDLLAGGSATAATLAPWLNGDFSIVGALTGVSDGYIKVGDNSVIIDGVEYESIFLDPSMASELHTQAFDFITQKAIISNSSGILADGVGYLNDVPIYNVNGVNTSQAVNYDISGGSGPLATMTVYERSPSYPAQRGYRLNTVYNGTQVAQHQWISVNSFPISCSFTLDSNFLNVTVIQNLATGSSFTNTSPSEYYGIFQPDYFTYRYVSGVIDADPLPLDFGFQAFVPTQTMAQAGFYPGTYVIDGGAGTDNIIQLIELLDNIYGQEQLKQSEFTDVIEPPVPPVETTIADTAYSELHHEMTDIKNNQAHANSAIDNIDSNIDVIGRTVDHLDDTVTDIEGYIQSGTSDIVDSVDTAGQAVVDGLSDVEGAIDTYGQSVVTGLGSVETAVDTAGQSVVDSVDAQTQALEQSIADVADKVESLDTTVDQVIEKVESHPLDLFGAFLDRLTQIPVIKDLFDGIKRHVGIWHYVVEWLQCIGSFLAFFIGLFSDVAYCMVVPIYACVAGMICLAFYKRFGR